MYNFFNWLPLLKHTHTLNPSYRWWMWRVTASCWGGWSFSISATSRCGSGKKWVDSLSPVCSHLQSCWIINSTYLWLHSKLILQKLIQFCLQSKFPPGWIHNAFSFKGHVEPSGLSRCVFTGAVSGHRQEDGHIWWWFSPELRSASHLDRLQVQDKNTQSKPLSK